MMEKQSKELDKWNDLKTKLGNVNIQLGPYFSYQLRHSPRHILFSLSRYKFAAKLIGSGKRVLEIGCSEGLGTLLLAENASQVTGIDIDPGAIQNAAQNFASEKMQFIHCDFLDANFGEFDAVLSFDVIEHIYPEHEAKFFERTCQHLTQYGLCLVGTPNQTAEVYASEISRYGHVNVYNWQRLQKTMEQYFHQVFLFSANDEMIHTGFYPMAHYLIGLGVGKKNG